jgi:putative transposase
MTKQAQSIGFSRPLLLRQADDEDWAVAREVATTLQKLMHRGVTTAEVQDLAQRWGVSRATVWRRLKRFRQEIDLTALIARKRGQKAGSTYLSTEVEFAIKEVARRFWSLSENATVNDIALEVRKECKARNLDPPSPATVGRRLKALRVDPANFKGEARQHLQSRRRLVKANYGIAEPLAVVQIDHTLADVILVDPQTHVAIGRPTLTVAIDINTRCVMGFCVSLEAPSSLLVGLCLEHAIFPKEEALRDRGSTVEWPMFGQMKSIHSDNGREFHSRAFSRGCDLNGIEIIYRPPATPRFGGHIERLIGTFMRRTRLLPGNTYSDMLGRRPKRTESKASLTLEDYRWFLTEEIERYHKTIHRTLGISPFSAWEQARKTGRGLGSVSLPNKNTFLIDYLPLRQRVVSREGIEVDALKFSCADLQPQINPSVPRIVRIDPRDISRVYLESATGSYLTVPLLRKDLPAMSWWEWKSWRRHQRNATQSDPAGTWSYFPSAGIAALQSRSSTQMSAGRTKARKEQWQAIQALQALPTPDTSLHPLVRGEEAHELPDWEILE